MGISMLKSLNVSNTQLTTLDINGNLNLTYINVINSTLDETSITNVANQLVEYGITSGKFIIPPEITTTVIPWTTLISNSWTFTE
jgi:hypothetical protein